MVPTPGVTHDALRGTAAMSEKAMVGALAVDRLFGVRGKTVLVTEDGEDGVAKMNMPEKYRQHDDAHIDVTITDLAGFLQNLAPR